jgi:biotin carboxyl carrier protein
VPQEVIEAPIPGKILSVAVTVGDSVNEGDTVCVIEAMKMENPILAPVKGSITQVGVSPNQVVKTGQLIAAIEY